MISVPPQESSAQPSINFQVFYDDLSPYGDWVSDPKNGYVWLPDVDYEFTPYATSGYWAFTDAGWTWVSDYSWGWAPFHYGRWLYDNHYGWAWVPGDEWGPGWVSWRSAEGYYGWAPIGPGISIPHAYSSEYSVPSDYWTFVRDKDFGRANIKSHAIDKSSNTEIISNSSVINNTLIDHLSRVRYNSGPNRTAIQKQSGRLIAPVVMRERNDPGQNISRGELDIFRPHVTKSNPNGGKPIPNKITKKEEVSFISQRISNTQSKSNNQKHTNQEKHQQP